MINAEKMQKIYEATGVEPRWWMDYGDGSLHKDKSRKHLTGFSDFAHYPAEQLWEMLPERVEGIYKIRLGKRVLAYVKISDPERIPFHAVHIEELLGVDLHTALIDMVLWCIEKGYICKIK